MNIIVRGISRLTKTCFTNTIEGNLLNLRRFSINHSIQVTVKRYVLFSGTSRNELLQQYKYSVLQELILDIATGNFSNLRKFSINNSIQGSYLSNLTKTLVDNSIWGLQQIRNGTSLYQMHKRGPYKRKKKKVKPLDGKPFAKGVVLKTLIKKPKKPNSANRKCVLVRLSTGREMVAYVPGVGHNLQEHNIVLCRVGRLRDVPGVKIKCVRGKFDLAHVIKQPQR